MRGLALALVCAAAATAAHAQERPQRPAPVTPEQQLEQKLASPFLQKVWWELDWDAARKRADAEGKLILGYFTTAGY
ncbi:MAG: hypothetical protein ACYTGX_07805 [Planctomycetota bacterium]